MKSKWMHRNLIKIGVILALVGLVIFLSLFFVIKPYGASSGVGMAGLPVAFAMVVALLVAFIGIVMTLISFFLSLRQK